MWSLSICIGGAGPAEDPPPPPPAEEAQTGGGEEAAGGDERDPGEAGAVGGGDGAAVNGLEEEAANALLYEHNAFKMGSSCLLVCLVRLGFTKVRMDDVRTIHWPIWHNAGQRKLVCTSS